jgi:cysteine protease ATG4
MFKSDVMGGVDYKRFVRYFYDPPPKYDESGTSVWFLGNEYAATPPKPVSTTDHEDVVEIESSTDSHDPSDAATSTTEDSHASKPQTSSFEDAQQISGDNVPSVSNDPADGGWPLAFLDDFESRAWMTYRSNFPPIPRSQDPAASSAITFSVRLRNIAERDGFSSDTGWGCMIRSGQSLLANALIMLHLGRDWRRPRHLPSSSTSTPQPPTTPSSDPHPQPSSTTSPSPTPAPTSTSTFTPSHASILSLFSDDPLAPFSIHSFVAHGATSCNVHPGQWFGPSATASCISSLVTSHPFTNLRVYITPTGSEVYEDRFLSISRSTPTSTQIQPTLILLGIRLGIDRITPVYHEALKSSLTYPQSIGIAGGRPSSSHYFVGHQDSTFLYLDPHETRPAFPFHPDPNSYTAAELDSMHTRRLRGLHISQMDPSMLIGFLIKDEADWADWKERVRNVKGKGIVNVYDKEPPHTSFGKGAMAQGLGREREGAVDEVVVMSEDEDDETVLGEGEKAGDGEGDGVTVRGDEEVSDVGGAGVKEVDADAETEAEVPVDRQTQSQSQGQTQTSNQEKEGETVGGGVTDVPALTRSMQELKT